MAFGQAVENDDRVPVHVFHKFGGGNGAVRRRAVFLIDKVRIELVAAEQAVFPPCRGDIALQCIAGNEFARGIAGIGENKGVGAFLMDEVLHLRGGDGEGVFLFRPHGQQDAAVAQAVEIILIGGIIGVFVGDARAVRQNGEKACQGKASARGEADVVRRIFRSAPAVIAG